jgi:DNA modification methylase
MTTTIIHSDVYSGINSLDDNSIHIVITSPPYWKQRDYGFEGQIGQEKTPEEYIGKLITIFRVLKNKLKDNGIFFLNVGDKYIQRYGKSYLGLIPYKLAYFMKKDGWILNDILIWYKPNHMPSSVKDRFTNTYEPIFVFSKSQNNIYKKQSSVLKVNLQTNRNKHIAVFPEKLVKELLNRIDLTSYSLPSMCHVLDPFAGSGTTGKVAIKHGLSCTMIEANKEYVEIIKDRCKVDNIISLPSADYQPVEIKEEEFNIVCSDNNLPNVLMTNNKDEYYKMLSCIPKDTNVPYFLGFKKLDIDIIYKTSLLSKYGLSVRNMLIVNTGDTIFPIFMITGKEKYLFSLDNIKVSHKSSIDWHNKDFTGYKVIDKLNDRTGIIVSVHEKYPNGFPKWVSVLWDDKTVSCEYVIYDEKDIPSVKFVCSRCNSEINNEERCLSCNAILWVDSYVRIQYETLKPKCKELKHKSIPADINKPFNPPTSLPYTASPGKRAVLQGEYFFVSRLYNVNQKLVSNLLDYKRKEKGLTRTDFIDKLPKGYRYKAEHWFRKDMGGSIPTLKDWLLIKQIIDVDDYDDYILKTCLKLQAVKPLRGGKNIGDYLEIEEDKLVRFLEKASKI